MDGQIIQALSLASAGITVAATGAALLVIRVVLSSGLSREIDEELRNNHRG